MPPSPEVKLRDEFIGNTPYRDFVLNEGSISWAAYVP